ncbi:hypothetical protein P691DRAFT_296571 [Macrolepiota fuliginosa MF-IS2]|uniref:Uncharacterized protein n=1 Tax=Macrolepiota fuliginosa MF-IS2 TaxID=1400762 RepID=A0A9P6BYD3_9AGAR|nr:hypothetical protein P691DRAFT_296571 [Macrolepiota fuliginosa MF-IS2]
MSSVKSINEKTSESPTISEYSVHDIKDPPQDHREIISDTPELARDQPLKKGGSMRELREDAGRNLHYGLAGDIPSEEGSLKRAGREVKEDSEFPDGGLRAWLVVFGVHHFLVL